jgi:YidC/Oxa1 family membrane protein insertase
MFIKWVVTLCLSLFLLNTAFATVVQSDTENQLADRYPFFGMASYLNQVNYFLLDAGELLPLKFENEFILNKGEQFVAIGRFNILLIKDSEVRIEKVDERLKITSTSDRTVSVQDNLTGKNNLSAIDANISELRYTQLWWPIAQLAKGVEWLLIKIHWATHLSWGLSLAVFAVLIKVLLLPASWLTTRFQNQTAYVQSKLNPKLAVIKKSYKGEEAHNRIMAAHKELGVTPFYSLKPSLGFFIQVPVFIAIFNALGEMPQFVGQEFLWIKNLAYPDAVFSLGFTIPWLGNTFNLTPFLMAVTAIVAALTYKLEHVDHVTLKAKRKQLVYMGIVFLILFFPFPAAMTFYWFLANVLQLIEQNLRGLKKTDSNLEGLS